MREQKVTLGSVQRPDWAGNSLVKRIQAEGIAPCRGSEAWMSTVWLQQRGPGEQGPDPSGLVGTVRVLNSKRGRECFGINQIGNANLLLCKICSSLAPVTSNLGNLHSLGVLSRPGLPPCLSSALRDTSPRESWSLHTPWAEALSALCLDCLVRVFYSEHPWEAEAGLSLEQRVGGSMPL